MSAHMVASINAALEWNAAASSMPGEQVLGDRAVVASTDEHVLTAAVDGVGHGAEAAAAAHAAAHVLEQSAGQDPAAVILACHRALLHTRGAAISLASINVRAHTVTWLGVGNVEARLMRGPQPVPVTESLLLRSGVVGHELPSLTAQTTPIARGDVLIFATDGIRRDFADLLTLSGSCQEIADRVLAQHALGSDDALVLIVRYLARR
jgi:serine phosphatase RsbU (regulator of sigma subunit)